LKQPHFITPKTKNISEEELFKIYNEPPRPEVANKFAAGY
jgi:hypothetical protein